MAGTFTFKTLWSVRVPSAVTKVYTAPVLPTRLTEVGFVNTDSVAQWVSLYVAPNGSSSGTLAGDHFEFERMLLPPTGAPPMIFARNRGLDQGREIWVVSSANLVITCWGSGVEET